MNSLLENRISMYYKVREFYSHHLSTLEATASALTANVGTFNTQLDGLDTLMIMADTNSSGYATQKQNYRDTMQNGALAISGALYAYGKLNNDEPLAAKAYATKSSLNGKRDTDVLYFCERINTLADEHAAHLAPMGIPAAKITAYGNAVTTYKQAIQDPADKRGESKAARSEAENQSREIDKTLMITDSIMLAVKSDHSLLYAQYRADRLIDDNASGTSSPDVIEIIDAGTTEIIYEVPYLQSRSFKLKNLSDSDLQWALSEDGTSPINGEWQNIGPKSTSVKLSSTLGENGNILIVNNPGDANATIELTIVE